MKEGKEFHGNLHEAVNFHKKLAYSQEFKTWVEAHPSYFSTARKLVDELYIFAQEQLRKQREDRNKGIMTSEFPIYGETLEKDDLLVSFTQDSHYNTFKVTAGDETFFVKLEVANSRENRFYEQGGYGEIKSAHAVKELLEKKFPDVRVVDYEMGFEDKNTKRRYLVARWMDLPSLRELRRKKVVDDTEVESLEGLLSEVQEYLYGQTNGGVQFYDISPVNTFYDPISRKLILFDINRRSISE